MLGLNQDRKDQFQKTQISEVAINQKEIVKKIKIQIHCNYKEDAIAHCLKNY